MSSVTSRAIGAIVGGLIADSAGVPLHWLYNVQDLQAILAKYDSPEFLPQSHCPFYSLPAGSFSCFGDQAFVTLKSLVNSKGFNVDHYKSSVKEHFGSGSAYDIDHSGAKPIIGPWVNGNILTFIKNYDEKKDKTGQTDSADMDSVCKVAPLVAFYAGDPKLLDHVETLVRVTQDNDTAVKYARAAAKLLENYVLNGKNPSAIPDLAASVDAGARTEIQTVIDDKNVPHLDAVQKYGSSCKMPGNFKNALHCLLSTSDFASSATTTLVAGGDNCSRLVFVGACLGAQGGEESLPADWLSKTSRIEEVKTLAKTLVAMRGK